VTGVRCVVFDVDDTLYLERDYIRSGFSVVGRWAASELGIGDFFDRAWRLFVSGVRGTIFDQVLASVGVPVDQHTLGEMVHVYRTHRPAIVLLDDARRAMSALRGRVALAALTDGPLASQTAKIMALGLEDWLDPILCTETLGAAFRKPSRLAFEQVEATTGLRTTACLYAADNPLKDFAGPKELGWRTVRVRRPGGLYHAYPSGTDVDSEVADLDGLVGLLGLA
jgi:putative hydrolase of the HAD superfamily